MKFESAINICQSNCGILHLSPLHLCKDMHSFDAATMPGCNFSILMGILCDYPQIRSSKIAVPCNAMPCHALLPCRGRGFSVPCPAVPCVAVPCLAMPCRTVPCPAVPCYAMSCPAMPCRVLPCYVMPCHALPCLALLCHALPYRVLPDVCNAEKVLI